jgi:hypothetical protein
MHIGNNPEKFNHSVCVTKGEPVLRKISTTRAHAAGGISRLMSGTGGEII